MNETLDEEKPETEEKDEVEVPSTLGIFVTETINTQDKSI